MEIVTKEYAIENGLKRYFTGSECKNGHVAERYTKNNGGCVSCSMANNKKYDEAHKEQQREVNKQWKINNREKNCQHSKTYRDKNK